MKGGSQGRAPVSSSLRDLPTAASPGLSEAGGPRPLRRSRRNKRAQETGAADLEAGKPALAQRQPAALRAEAGREELCPHPVRGPSPAPPTWETPGST